MKPVSSFFAATYAEAREKFLKAADAAGAEVRSEEHTSELQSH